MQLNPQIHVLFTGPAVVTQTLRQLFATAHIQPITNICYAHILQFIVYTITRLTHLLCVGKSVLVNENKISAHTCLYIDLAINNIQMKINILG